MKLQVTGRNLDVSPAIVDYAERKLTKLARHLSDSTRVELELRVEKNPSIAEANVAEVTIWTKGPVLRARETSTDMYASIDLVAEKLERQVKRYRERRHRGRPHHGGGHQAAPQDMDADLEAPLDAVEEGEPAPEIVRTKRFNMKPMHAEEAALQLELVGHEFFVFLNADTDEVAVIYRRRDGHFGVIEPVRG